MFKPDAPNPKYAQDLSPQTAQSNTKWVVVKNMVPVWVLIIIRHLTFRVPKKVP